MNGHHHQMMISEATPLVQAELERQLQAEGVADHLKAVSPARIGEVAGKIVNLLPTILTAAAAAGFQVPATASGLAAFAVQVFLAYQKHFPTPQAA